MYLRKDGDAAVRCKRPLSVFVGSLALMVLWLCLSMTPSAEAAYVAAFEQIGSNVVATGSGSLDVTSLVYSGPTLPDTGLLIPDNAFIIIAGQNPTPNTTYPLITGEEGPTSFGSGAAVTEPTSSSGNVVGISGLFRVLIVPLGYVSGTPLGMSTAEWDDANFASLGLTPGTYVWTWGGGGANADTFTLRISSIAEPASLPLFGAGLAALGITRRKRNSV